MASDAQKRTREFRGTRRRIQRIRMRDNWSVEMWILVAVAAIALLILIPWLIRHPLPRGH